MYRELRHKGESAGSEEVAGDEHSGVRPAKTFASAAWGVAVADVSMSLDNVLLVASIARDNPALLFIGLTFSVLFMGFAANYVAKLIERYHWINYIGLAVILWVACSMIFEGFMGGEHVMGLRQVLGLG
jgi:predicted tellurium resistance membrane protein TerC